MDSADDTCRICGKAIRAWREPEPDDERICGECWQERDDAQRDQALGI
jgi:predicted nucleic acid-binding Zn ribbon protein